MLPSSSNHCGTPTRDRGRVQAREARHPRTPTVQVTRYAHRSEEFDVHSDGHTTGDRDDSVTSAVREVELNVSLTALKHRLAVPSIREPDSGWGATEPIGKHTSQGGSSNNVAGSVQIRVETLRLSELIV